VNQPRTARREGRLSMEACARVRDLCARFRPPHRTVHIMEVCGTHTMAIAAAGLKSLLPPELKLTSGPGCPVCVTDQTYVDQAVMLAARDDVAIATYGDMMRVPGQGGSLSDARAGGARVEVVYSADAAVELARQLSDRQVVFLGVGFETTAPGTALAVLRARNEGIANFSVLVSHKLVVPAMRALLSDETNLIDGFLCPGHVSVIIGCRAYDELVRDFNRPCVVAGFDPPQILIGIEEILRQLLDGSARSCSVYPSVSPDGNAQARKMTEQVFARCDAQWRALGAIPLSGLRLRGEFRSFDALERFDLPEVQSHEPPGCRCGDVICGRCDPHDCALFANRCTPRDPVGPCMVSSEGACAAAYKYERR